MFRGISNISIDAEGRISVPAKHRDALTKLVVVPNPTPDEKCLLVYPLSEWESVEKSIVSQPNSPEIKKIKRFFLGQAVDYVLDGNGRVLLTQSLREQATLGKKAVLVGQGNKFELWDEAVWEEMKKEFIGDASDESVADVLETLVF